MAPEVAVAAILNHLAGNRQRDRDRLRFQPFGPDGHGASVNSRLLVAEDIDAAPQRLHLAGGDRQRFRE